MELFGKIDHYTHIGNCKACSRFSSDEYLKVHISKSYHKNCEFLKEKDIKLPKPNDSLKQGNNLIVSWEEGEISPTPSFLRGILKQMDGHSTFIHCTAGRHRASMLSIAHLYHNLGYSFIDAICRVNSARKQYEEKSVTALNPQELRIIKNL